MAGEVLLLAVLACGAWAGLPPLPDCTPAQDAPFSTADPASFFGTSREIGNKATPTRVASGLRAAAPLPTGHFATGHIKNKDVWPMILIPYQALLKADGAVYDAYTMDR